MLWYFAVIIVLFIIVTWNNKRNLNKLYKRKGRDFKANYKAKKKNN